MNTRKTANKLIKYEDIYYDLRSDAILDKPVMNQERRIRETNVIEEVGEEGVQALLTRGSVRIQYHLLRLLQQSPIERAYAIEFTKHGFDVFAQHPDRKHINDVISSEGRDTKMFRTFAPYLADSLHMKNILGAECQRIIFDRAKTGHQNTAHSTLQGTQRDRCRVLDPTDPNHISHQFTTQEAARIAELLLQENPD